MASRYICPRDTNGGGKLLDNNDISCKKKAVLQQGEIVTKSTESSPSMAASAIRLFFEPLLRMQKNWQSNARPKERNSPWALRTNLAGLRFVRDSTSLLQNGILSPAWSIKLQCTIDDVKSGKIVFADYTDPWEYLARSQA